MRANLYDQDVERQVEKWMRGDESRLHRFFNAAMRPVDWLADRAVPENALDKADAAGVNYWFTTQTAESAHMVLRAAHLESKRDEPSPDDCL